MDTNMEKSKTLLWIENQLSFYQNRLRDAENNIADLMDERDFLMDAGIYSKDSHFRKYAIRLREEKKLQNLL